MRITFAFPKGGKRMLLIALSGGWELCALGQEAWIGESLDAPQYSWASSNWVWEAYSLEYHSSASVANQGAADSHDGADSLLLYACASSYSGWGGACNPTQAHALTKSRFYVPATSVCQFFWRQVMSGFLGFETSASGAVYLNGTNVLSCYSFSSDWKRATLFLQPGTNEVTFQSAAATTLCFLSQVYISNALMVDEFSVTPATDAIGPLTIQPADNAMLLSWRAGEGWLYNVQCATNLSPSVQWHNLAPHTNLTGAGTLCVTNAGPAAPSCFYRLSASPAPN